LIESGQAYGFEIAEQAGRGFAGAGTTADGFRLSGRWAAVLARLARCRERAEENIMQRVGVCIPSGEDSAALVPVGCPTLLRICGEQS